MPQYRRDLGRSTDGQTDLNQLSSHPFIHSRPFFPMNHRYRAHCSSPAPCYPPLAKLLPLFTSLKLSFFRLLIVPPFPGPRSLALVGWLYVSYRYAQLAFSIFIDDCAVPSLRREEEGTQSSADSEPRMEPLTSYDLKHTRFACHHHHQTPRSAVPPTNHHPNSLTHTPCTNNNVLLMDSSELLLLLEPSVGARRGPFAITVFVQVLRPLAPEYCTVNGSAAFFCAKRQYLSNDYTPSQNQPSSRREHCPPFPSSSAKKTRFRAISPSPHVHMHGKPARNGRSYPCSSLAHIKNERAYPHQP